MIQIGREDFDEIVSLLSPYVQTERDRKALITPLFINHPALHDRIDWSGHAKAFSTGLVELLLRRGEIEPNRPALFLLLEDLRSSVGVDVQQRIDGLIDRLETSSPQAAPSLTRDIEVFLCYSSQDRITAQSLRTALIEAGISVWQDFDRIQGGARFALELQQAIRRADAVVVLVTKAATATMWVENEVHFAVDVRKPIIPLLLQADVTKMMAIYSLHHIHMYADWETGLNKLVQRLDQLGPSEQMSAPAHPAVSVPSHLWVSPTSRPARESPPAGAPRSEADVDPFIYGTAVPPEMFVGRRAVLREIRGRVGHYATLQSLSIVANRRMGKTSLLRYVAQNCRTLFPTEYDYAAVYVDAMDPRAQTCQGFMRILRRNMSRQLGRELWPEAHDGKLVVLNESLEELARDERVRLVVLLDEWESVMAYQEMDALIEALRACGSLGRIGMVTATAYRLSDLKEQGKLTSPFPNIFKTVFLGNMPPAEWREVIRRGFERSSVAAEDSDYVLVGDLAGGHPYLTQLAGSLIWQARRKGWDGAKVRSDFAEQARMIFTAIWQRLSPEQVRAVRMALGIGERSPVPENVMTSLRSRGVLTEDGDAFCAPFAEFVLREVERRL